ncbi:hypothetical protein A2U01_0114129, partial [Trifolium medium]|nr:hypothetical protein [Trifolium medium]
TAVLVSEQVIVREPQVKEPEPKVEKTQQGELKDQEVAGVQLDPETAKIEAEKDITQHLEVEHSINEQHS